MKEYKNNINRYRRAKQKLQKKIKIKFFFQLADCGCIGGVVVLILAGLMANDD